MARPNYQYKKRQKEIARKKKKEQKRLSKLAKNDVPTEEDTNPPQEEGDGIQVENPAEKE